MLALDSDHDGESTPAMVPPGEGGLFVVSGDVEAEVSVFAGNVEHFIPRIDRSLLVPEVAAHLIETRRLLRAYVAADVTANDAAMHREAYAKVRGSDVDKDYEAALSEWRDSRNPRTQERVSRLDWMVHARGARTEKFERLRGLTEELARTVSLSVEPGFWRLGAHVYEASEHPQVQLSRIGEPEDDGSALVDLVRPIDITAHGHRIAKFGDMVMLARDVLLVATDTPLERTPQPYIA